MKFLEPAAYQPLALSVYSLMSVKIAAVLPSAQVEHIGSSSIAGCLSKGDLDIFVGVEPGEFSGAIEKLRGLGFLVKEDSLRTAELCPFIVLGHGLAIDVQRVALGSKFEFFLDFRDRVGTDAELLREYNQLKVSAWNLSEDQYREVKSRFIERVLARS